MQCVRLARLCRSYRNDFVSRRLILSNAYACTKIWEEKKRSKLLQQTEPYEFLNEVKKKFVGGGFASAVDVDLVANIVNSADQLDDVRLLLYKLRHCPETAETLPSMNYALVRNYVKFHREEELLQMLYDPINYGIFPDPVAANILIDHFLRQQKYKEAAKVSCFMMLQEDFDNPILCYLSAYSCFLYWKSEQTFDANWEVKLYPAESKPVEDDDEEVVFRVPWLKLPFNDDHFDLMAQPLQLVGKTLAWYGRALPAGSRVAPTFEFLGHCLHGKYADAASAARSASYEIYADVLDLIRAKCLPTDVAATQQPSEDASVPKSEESESSDVEKLKHRSELNAVIDSLPTSSLIKGDFAAAVLAELQRELPAWEQADIQTQVGLFAKWNEIREKKMHAQVVRFLNRERLKRIEEQKAALAAEEELLTFFDRREELEKRIDPKLKEMELLQRRAMQAGELPPDDEYIIPEIRPRASKPIM